MTELLPWLSLATLLAIIGGFVFLFVRHGSKVRRDPNRRHEDGVDTAIGIDSGPSND